MDFVTRGFQGRPRGRDERLPPGQYLTGDFPVLSAGPTSNVDHDEFEPVGRGRGRHSPHVVVERALMALPAETVTVDIHCVTSWSRLDTEWRGVSLDTLLADVETAADFALVHAYGGYTTNLPLEDLLDGQAWVAYGYDGDDLRPEHGGPARLLVPHLYFWKSAKWVRGIEPDARGRPRLLGAPRLPRLRRPMARAAVPGGLSARRAWREATLVERRPETDSAVTLVLDVDGWPGHLPGQHVDVRLTAPDGYTATRSLLRLGARARRPRRA